MIYFVFCCYFGEFILKYSLCKLGIKNREEGRSRPVQPQNRLPEPARIIRPTPQPAQYNRYDQERFNRQKEETEGFKIDTMGTYHGMSLKSVTDGSAAQKKQQIAQMPPGRPRDMRVGINRITNRYNHFNK